MLRELNVALPLEPPGCTQADGCCRDSCALAAGRAFMSGIVRPVAEVGAEALEVFAALAITMLVLRVIEVPVLVTQAPDLVFWEVPCVLSGCCLVSSCSFHAAFAA